MQRTLRAIAIIAALGLGLPLAACTGHGHVRVSGHVQTPPPPTLVHIGAGIWVVEDYDRPVFYHDGMYWLYSDGIWMRSTVHTGSFVRVQASAVPPVLVRIDRPRRYVHYKPRGNVRVRQAPPPRARPTNTVRDHRRDKAHGHDRNKGKVRDRSKARGHDDDKDKARDQGKVRDHRDKRGGGGG